MRDMLTSMGAASMFNSGEADFYEMCAEPFHIDDVMRSVRITVDEDGTEAAAVTNRGISTSPGPVERKTFHADRPFIYAVVENSTGQIHFMGTFMK